MPGTIEGGQRAAATNKRRHGEDFYTRIGALGGSKSRLGGFASNRQCECSEFPEPHKYARCAGRLGGYISRRKPKVAA